MGISFCCLHRHIKGVVLDSLLVLESRKRVEVIRSGSELSFPPFVLECGAAAPLFEAAG